MRTTINLPADLHAAVAPIAAHGRKSMIQTVADFDTSALMRVDKATGLPAIRSPRPISGEDVRAVEDD